MLEVTAICSGLIYVCVDAQIYKKLSPELPLKAHVNILLYFGGSFLTYSTDAAKGETGFVAAVSGAEITMLYDTVY